MSVFPPAAVQVLDEARDSGLSLTELPGNTAKVRLVLDLASQLPVEGRASVLDAGCGGRYFPLNLWEPLLPFASRLDVVGIDVAQLEQAREHAARIGFPIDVRAGSILDLEQQFGRAAFDVVVSTQVLEHVRDWRRAVRELAAVLRPGGLLLLTCDSGDLDRTAADRARLRGKRAYARLVSRMPAAGRAGARFASGEWEEAPTLEGLREAAVAVGLEVEQAAHYAVRDIKDRGGAGARLLAWAFEEALRAEQPDAIERRRYRILYLRARQPLQPPVSPL